MFKAFLQIGMSYTNFFTLNTFFPISRLNLRDHSIELNQFYRYMT